MSTAQPATTLHGSCHCGGIQVEFTTRQDLQRASPRACDCSFCQKHGAAYLSDPSGTLRIVAAGASTLRSYRQGSEAASFQLCARCGVLIAVLFERDGKVYGAINAWCLDERARLGASVPASPQLLSPQEKVSRWLQLWVPDVQVVTSTTE